MLKVMGGGGMASETASETLSFERYQSFSIISKEAVKQPYCLAKNMIFIPKILMLPVHIMTWLLLYT